MFSKLKEHKIIKSVFRLLALIPNSLLFKGHNKTNYNDKEVICLLKQFALENDPYLSTGYLGERNNEMKKRITFT